MDVEHRMRWDGGEIRNFLHRTKRRVEEGWPNDQNGVEAAQHAAERETRGRQRRQKDTSTTR